MTTARRSQLRLDTTPFYHCTTRCVRRAFLCGFDKLTGKNLDHRRTWMEQRIFLLCQVICIDIAAYALMSNHYHLVLKVDSTLADALTDDQVITRWRKLYKGPGVIQRYLEKQTDTLKDPSLHSTPASPPITFKDYLDVRDWTGRELKCGKRGVVAPDQPPIMARLGYTPEQWMKTQTPRVSWMLKAVGQIEAVRDYAAATGQRWSWQGT